MPIANDVSVEELLTALAGRDQSAVVAAMQAGSAKALYQVVFDKGHSVATVKHQGDKATADAEIARLTTETTAQKDQIKQLSEKQPDLAKMQAEHATAIATLESKQKGVEDALKATLQSERMSHAEFLLRGHLIEQGVDSEYAEVMVDKARKNNRLRPNAKGVVEAFRADVDTPFAATDKKSGLALLSEELKTTVPAKFINVNGDAGSGHESGAGGAGKGGKTLFEAQRADVKAKEAQRGNNNDTGASRLSGVAPRKAASG